MLYLLKYDFLLQFLSVGRVLENINRPPVLSINELSFIMISNVIPKQIIKYGYQKTPLWNPQATENK